ncbi:MAG: glycerate kinase [Acidobacteria bacterium]|nr:glycerate kinase [Acidobacteriota bacterium]
MCLIVIAPSGFKESLSAEEATKIIAKGLRKVFKDAEITEIILENLFFFSE